MDDALALAARLAWAATAFAIGCACLLVALSEWREHRTRQRPDLSQRERMAAMRAAVTRSRSCEGSTMRGSDDD